MKFSIISDTHLGFGSGERRMDAVLAFEEAVKKSMKMADAILFAGDMFDSPFPRSDAVFHAVRILSMLKRGKDVEMEFGRDVGFSSSGMPFIAITGNHERRSRKFKDPVQRLEDAGLLIRLHGEGIKIGDSYVYGVSSVPERFASKVFEKLSPSPMPGMFNIFMFHQSIEGFVYSPSDRPTLSLSHLPKGFDLYIDGHIHARQMKDIGSGRLLICGSTILTQLKNEGRKGFHIVDTEKGEIEFHEIENQRDVMFLEVGSDVEPAREKMDAFLSVKRKMKPIIRITGGAEARALVPEYSDRAIIVLKALKGDKKGETLAADEPEEEEEDEIFHMLAEGRLEEVVERLKHDYKSKAEKLEVP